MERFDIVAWTPRSVAAPLPASMVQQISSWLPVALGARGESVGEGGEVLNT
jgi:hypothetical protein